MACDPEILKNVPLFALLDAEEIAVLATQVELKTFAARERIYKKDQPGGQKPGLFRGRRCEPSRNHRSLGSRPAHLRW